MLIAYASPCVNNNIEVMRKVHPSTMSIIASGCAGTMVKAISKNMMKLWKNVQTFNLSNSAHGLLLVQFLCSNSHTKIFTDETVLKDGYM